MNPRSPPRINNIPLHRSLYYTSDIDYQGGGGGHYQGEAMSDLCLAVVGFSLPAQ